MRFHLLAIAVTTSVLGCAGTGSTESDTAGQDGSVNETIVSLTPDGSLNVRTVYVSQAEADAQVAEKEEMMRAFAEGRAPNQEISGSVHSQYGYWPDDVTASCLSSDFWFNSGGVQNGERVCFRKNTVGGLGEAYLVQFYYQYAGTLARATHSWWAGFQTGGFRRNWVQGPGLTFSAYERCDGCTVNPNFQFFSFD